MKNKNKNNKHCTVPENIWPINYAIISDSNNSLFPSSSMILSVCPRDVTRRTFGQSSDGHVNDQINLAVYRDHMYISPKLLIPHIMSLVTDNWTMLYKKTITK